MKIIIRVLFMFCLVFITSCDIDEIANLKDTFKISVNPDPVTDKKEIAIVDAVSGDAVNASIKFIGNNSSNIYTSSGDKDIILDNGLTVVGLHRSVSPSEENPIEITAEISANGYLTKKVIINFDGNPLENITISLLDRNNLPENVKVKEADITLDATNKTTSDLELETKSVFNNADFVKIVVPSGSNFYDEDGNSVTTSTANISLETYEINGIQNPSTTYSVLEEFPNNIVISENDFIVPTRLFKISANSGGNSLIPSNIRFNLLNEDEDIYQILTDGTLYKLPKSNLRKNAKTPYKNQLEPTGFFNYNGTKDGSDNLWSAWFLVGGAGGLSTNITDPKLLKGLNFKNNGPAADFYLEITNEGRFVGTARVTLFAEETKNIKFSGLPYLYGGLHNVKVSIIKTGSIFPQELYTFESYRNIDLIRPDLLFNIGDSDKYPSDNIDIPFKIECPDFNFSLDETTVRYKENINSRFNRYAVYGKIINGQLSGKFPKLDPEKEYLFKFFYQKNRESKPIKGKDFKTIIDSYNLENICNLIEKGL